MTDSIKILVVDDESVVVRSCKRILETEGYEIDGASGGREAIITMEKKAYDLVITDLKMPEVDGITLIRWIKKSRPDTGVLIITGYPSQETIKEALELGIIDYVPKPFTPAVLADVVGRAVEWKKKKVPEEEAKKEEEFPPSMIAELDKMIKSHRNKPGCLIPVLQRAQEMVGYLPPIVQKRISKGLNIPAAEVHSVTSFYSFFTMTPRGDHIIKICLGTACYVKGIEEVLGKIKENLRIDVGGITGDKRFSLEAVRCLGACGLAPVMVIDHDTYSAVSPKKITQILDEYQPVSK
ncbi:MAG TPA: response regulator [Nitrospirae bacterium]|nr:response regulator [Nitrospirota bacterium]